jgi:hypothetical protein
MHPHRLASPIACLLLATAGSFPLSAQISLQITVGPPPIPVYEQPDLPQDGYLWTPGYWAWGEDGYFWVPGTWVEAPERGLLWTPGYWAWSGDYFEFHTGYWGTHVGYYGGINYGYGYGGSGFEGGYWQGRNYYYNRSVSHVNNTRVANVYNKTVIVNNTTIAYNGGAGGVRTAPSAQERTVERERHVQSTAVQTQHHQAASRDKELVASVNRGKPPVAATARPADFSPKSVVPAKAPGGRVEETTLKATPKTMAPPAKNPARDARPTSPLPPPTRAPGPVPDRRPQPAPIPAPERRPEPAPAPSPGRRPEPPPAPAPVRPPAPAPIPAPDRRPEPAPRPAPERRPEPTPAPERRPTPAPERRPEPTPAPERRPAPAPERRPEPAPHERPAESKPKPEPPRDKER